MAKHFPQKYIDYSTKAYISFDAAGKHRYKTKKRKKHRWYTKRELTEIQIAKDSLKVWDKKLQKFL